MNAPGQTATPSPPWEEGGAASAPSGLPWQPSLAGLRGEGAQRFDPVRFRYLEALSRRMEAEQGAVLRILEEKLHAALADYAERFKQARQTTRDKVVSLSAQHPGLARELRPLFTAGDYRGVRRLGAQAALGKPCAPLAELNRYIRAATQDGGGDLPATGAAQGPRPELKSVQRFREVWSKMAAVDHVAQAIERGPENAGPLNSHMLVLRSLAMMREISPDYLRRFLSHVDALLWLEQARQKPAPAEAKPARRTRQKK